MEVIVIKDQDYKLYMDFYKKIQAGYHLKKDNMNDFLEDILSGKSVLNGRMDRKTLMVSDGNKPIMGTVLAHVKGMEDYVQMSFFESISNNVEAFDLLLEAVVNFAKEKGAKYITGSLNIHVNYGLGFLASHYQEQSSFGMNYNPDFYVDLFEKNNFDAVELSTFKKEMCEINVPLSSRAKERLCGRYSVRSANFNDYKNEIELYTSLNNKAFKDHLFYYERFPEEDYELYKPFKWLLKEENILFVEKEGKAVGFMLWYPDYSQLIKGNKGPGVRTVIDYKLLRRPIDTFKIVEMGIIPSEQKKGAILAMFNHLEGLVKGRFKYMESSWILKENRDSANFGIKWADSEAKRYKAFVRRI